VSFFLQQPGYQCAELPILKCQLDHDLLSLKNFKLYDPSAGAGVLVLDGRTVQALELFRKFTPAYLFGKVERNTYIGFRQRTDSN